MNRLLNTLLSISLAGTLSAQSVVIPVGATNSSGDSVHWAPGHGLDERRLILVDMPLALHNTTLTEIAFRREESTNDFSGGLADLTVKMSIAPHTAVLAVPTFDLNHGANVSTVFQGQVSLAPSPSADGRTVQWSNAFDVIAIPLTPGFAFTSGTLAIEFESRPVAGQEAGYWAADGFHEATNASVQRIGESCSPSAKLRRPDEILSSIGIAEDGLVPGSTATFSATGQIGATAAFGIGFQSTDIDLSFLGFAGPGCRLRVVPELAPLATLEARPPLSGGFASFPIQIPVDPGALGLTFFVQSFEVSTAVYTSELAQCTIAGSIPSIGVSGVRADIVGPGLPPTGKVATNRGPVLRFTYQ